MSEYYLIRDSGTVIGVSRHPRSVEDGEGVMPTDPTPVAEDHPDVVAYFASIGVRPYVSKLTIVRRLEAAGLRVAAKTALAANDYLQDCWDSCVEVNRNDTDVRDMLTSIGADVDAILAPE